MAHVEDEETGTTPVLRAHAVNVDDQVDVGAGGKDVGGGEQVLGEVEGGVDDVAVHDGIAGQVRLKAGDGRSRGGTVTVQTFRVGHIEVGRVVGNRHPRRR